MSHCISSPELGTEVGSCQLSLCNPCPTHLHAAPSEGPVEILDSQLPAFGVFHELRAILGEEEQSQGSRGHGAPVQRGSLGRRQKGQQIGYQKAWSPVQLLCRQPQCHGPSLGFGFSHAECEYESAWPAQWGCCEEHKRRCKCFICWKPSWLEGELWEGQDCLHYSPSKHRAGA